MKNLTSSIAVALVLVAGCTDEPVLGEQQCNEPLAGCSTDPRVITLGLNDALPQSTLVFDVEPFETLAPGWQVEVERCQNAPRDDGLTSAPCAPAVATVPSKDGGSWLVNTHVGATGWYALRVNSAGQTVQTIARPSSLPAQVVRALPDGQGGLVVVAAADDGLWAGAARREVTVYRHGVDGSSRTTNLRMAEDQPALELGSLVLLADGSLQARDDVAARAPGHVWTFDAEGQVRGHSQFAPALPDDSQDVSLYRSATSRSASIAEGQGYAFLTSFLQHADTPIEVTGLVNLDALGELRWAVIFDAPGFGTARPRAFAMNAVGSAAVTGFAPGSVTPSPGFDDLTVAALDPDANFVSAFHGRRASFFGAAAAGVLMDDAGDVLTLHVTGERDDPRPMACKLHPGAEPSARCVAVDLCAGEVGLLPYWDAAVSERGAYFGASASTPAPSTVLLPLSFACLTPDEHAAAIDGRRTGLGMMPHPKSVSRVVSLTL